jgi:hypothetical protein
MDYFEADMAKAQSAASQIIGDPARRQDDPAMVVALAFIALTNLRARELAQFKAA